MNKRLFFVLGVSLFISSCVQKQNLVCEASTERLNWNPSSPSEIYGPYMSEITISVMREGNYITVNGEGLKYSGRPTISCKDQQFQSINEDKVYACRTDENSTAIGIGSKSTEYSELFNIVDKTNNFFYSKSIASKEVKSFERGSGVCR